MAGVLSKGKTHTWLDLLQKRATWLEGWKRDGAPLLQIETERLGVVEPGEGFGWHLIADIQCLKRVYKRGGRVTFYMIVTGQGVMILR